MFLLHEYKTVYGKEKKEQSRLEKTFNKLFKLLKNANAEVLLGF